MNIPSGFWAKYLVRSVYKNMEDYDLQHPRFDGPIEVTGVYSPRLCIQTGVKNHGRGIRWSK